VKDSNGCWCGNAPNCVAACLESQLAAVTKERDHWREAERKAHDDAMQAFKQRDAALARVDSAERCIVEGSEYTDCVKAERDALRAENAALHMALEERDARALRYMQDEGALRAEVDALKAERDLDAKDCRQRHADDEAEYDRLRAEVDALKARLAKTEAAFRALVEATTARDGGYRLPKHEQLMDARAFVEALDAEVKS